MPEPALRDFASRENAFFKFVICNPGDLEEVVLICALPERPERGQDLQRAGRQQIAARD